MTLTVPKSQVANTNILVIIAVMMMKGHGMIDGIHVIVGVPVLAQ